MGTKLQTYAGFFMAMGAAITAAVVSLAQLPMPPGHLLVYVAALGAAMSAFGNSIAPRNGAQTRYGDNINVPTMGSSTTKPNDPNGNASGH